MEVKSTIHLNNYTNQEKIACWYSPAEYNNITQAMFLTVDLITKISPSSANDCSSISSISSNSSKSSNISNSSNSSNSNSSISSLYCSRGLENVSIEDGLKYSTRLRRQNAIWSVIDEQNKQCQDAILQQQQQQQQQQQRTLMYDVVKIRNIYRYHTRSSEENAYSMGRIDAEDEEESALIEMYNNNINAVIDDETLVSSYSSLETTISASTMDSNINAVIDINEDDETLISSYSSLETTISASTVDSNINDIVDNEDDEKLTSSYSSIGTTISASTTHVYSSTASTTNTTSTTSTTYDGKNNSSNKKNNHLSFFVKEELKRDHLSFFVKEELKRDFLSFFV
jgi:hypothetical protein